MELLKGTVARMVKEKGFGFIKRIDASEEYFFHRSALADLHFPNLREGDPVLFAPSSGPKGLRAAEVRAR